jgi:hypothetical protein
VLWLYDKSPCSNPLRVAVKLRLSLKIDIYFAIPLASRYYSKHFNISEVSPKFWGHIRHGKGQGKATFATLVMNVNKKVTVKTFR